MAKEDLRYFQWIAGPDRGQIKVFKTVEQEENDLFVVFTDDSRMNENYIAPLNEKDLTGKMMAEIESPGNCWQFKEKFQEEQKDRIEQDWESQEKYEIPSADDIARADLTGQTGTTRPKEKRTKEIILVPPRPTGPQSSKFGWITNPPKPDPNPEPKPQIQQKQEFVSVPVNTTDPVYILISKSKKIDSELNMGMIISLPPKSLYNIAKETFEGGDEKFVEYIIQTITVDEIKQALKIALTEMYESSGEENKI